MKMWIRYDKKDKKKFIIAHITVYILIIAFGLLAAKKTNVAIPTEKEQLHVSIGAILVVLVIILGFANVLKVFWKFKSFGFFIAAAILFFLKTIIDVLVSTLFLVGIPLLLNDLIVQPYFDYLNITKYIEDFRLLNAKT